ncbi:MAG: phosphate ABC transporter permease PstA [Succinivibrionaceae bacterium]
MKTKRDVLSLFLRIIVNIAAYITIGILVFLLSYIFISGIPHLSLSMFAWTYTSENVSMMPAIINTIIMTLLALIIALPLGIGCAIYLVEYAKKGSKLVSIVRITTETLAGIPSIVYGLFGFLFFVLFWGWGYSILAGAFTMSIMILPLIMRTTEESLKSVPDTYREGSFGLGAGKVRTIFRVILPAAIPGISAGVILGIGRIVGETAALIYTAGTVAGIPNTLLNSGRTLAIHMYALLSEGLYMEQAYATAVILLLMVIIINLCSEFISRKLTKS